MSWDSAYWVLGPSGTWHRAVGKALGTDCGLPITDEMMETACAAPWGRGCPACTAKNTDGTPKGDE